MTSWRGLGAEPVAPAQAGIISDFLSPGRAHHYNGLCSGGSYLGAVPHRVIRIRKIPARIVFEIFYEGVHLPSGFFLRYAISFLNPADELLALSRNHVNVIVGQFSPLFAHFSFYLFPFPFQLIRIHCWPPHCCWFGLNAAHSEKVLKKPVLLYRSDSPPFSFATFATKAGIVPKPQEIASSVLRAA